MTENILEDFRVDQFTFENDPPLPSWAIGVIPFAIKGTARYRELGAQLATRDGRRMGNACVMQVEGRFVHILTDMGSKAVLTATELENEFYLPIWRMDPIAFLKRAQR